MPHDRFGRRVNPGDKVLIRATVKEVHTGETACNFNVTVDDPDNVGEYCPNITFNSRLVERADDAEPAASE